MIKLVQAYSTTDGRLFFDQREAAAHQHGIDIKDEVHEFFDYKKSSYLDTYATARVLAVIEWEVAKKMKEST